MKTKITFSISQKLAGHIKNVCVIAHSVDACWHKIYTALNQSKFKIEVLNVQEVSDSMPSGIFQADSQTIVSYKNVSSIVAGAAIHGNLEQGQTHK